MHRQIKRARLGYLSQFEPVTPGLIALVPEEGPKMSQLTAKDVIDRLALAPHPEGGWFRETWRGDPAADTGGRACGTAIYYLLAAGDFSHWHRVDAVEIWHWHAGAPLVLSVSENGRDAEARHLGGELLTGQSPQLIVPAGWWQSATSLGAWTLVGCTVSPGFDFAGFEMAPPEWRPHQDNPVSTPARKTET